MELKSMLKYLIASLIAIFLFSILYFYAVGVVKHYDTTRSIDTLYFNKEKIIIKEKEKLKVKYDTIEIHLRDSFYSTDFLQRAINLHRFIDTTECQPLFD